jgi:hypothetical protein
VRGGGSENVLLGRPAIALLVEIVWREGKTFQRIMERSEFLGGQNLFDHNRSDHYRESAARKYYRVSTSGRRCQESGR